MYTIYTFTLETLLWYDVEEISKYLSVWQHNMIIFLVKFQRQMIVHSSHSFSDPSFPDLSP